MRVLMLHNRYRLRGGEDGVAEAEAELLRSRGVEVRQVSFDNETEPEHALISTAQLGWNSSWSNPAYEHVLKVCLEFRPDVAHVHNFWMRLSPSIHAACHEAGVPTVQTLHNFRLFCTNALFKRDGSTCQDCLGKLPWRGVVRRCYRNSFVASAAVARMIVSNRIRGTWENDVDAFIALSEHSRSKFVAGGLHPERIFVKPNFVEDDGPSETLPSKSNIVLFVGRLSEEKGVKVLIEAWAAGKLSDEAYLQVVGDGPERASLEQLAAALGLSAPRVVFAGHRPPGEMRGLMSAARVVVMPSLFFECFPKTLVEAYAGGRGVIASEIGALDEIVSPSCGITFPANNVKALTKALKTVVRHDGLVDSLGANARADYLRYYTPTLNFGALMQIYEHVIEKTAQPVSSGEQYVSV